MVDASETSQWPTTIRAEFGRKRLDALLQSIALIGECKFGTLIGAGLGNAPGDRPIVGDTHDEAAFSGHQALSNRHVHALRNLKPSEAYRTRN